jgi:hypothetical protein
LKGINNFIDVCFLVDFVVTFFTSYKGPRGETVLKSTAIAWHYIQTKGFWLDLLALLGADVFESRIPMLFYFGLFKIFRLSRLSRMVAALNLPKDVKSLIQVCKLVFYLVIYIHISGCFLIWLVNKNKGRID